MCRIRRWVVAGAILAAGAACHRSPKCSFNGNPGSAPAASIRQIAQRYAAYAASQPLDPHRARSTDTVPPGTRALYYCEAILIDRAAASSGMSRKDLAQRVAPGDRALWRWLGIASD